MKDETLGTAGSLIELSPDKWNGISREMFVWNQSKEKYSKELVVGFCDGRWVTKDRRLADSFSTWYHAADPAAQNPQRIPIDTCINAMKEQEDIEREYKSEAANLYNSIWKYLVELKSAHTLIADLTKYKNILDTARSYLKQGLSGQAISILREVDIAEADNRYNSL